MTDSDSRHGIIPPGKAERGRPASPRGMKPGLTALGTAAVLGIYAAGFALTQEAAHGLDGPRRDSPRSTAQLEGFEESPASGGGDTGIPTSGDTGGSGNADSAGSGPADGGLGSSMTEGAAGLPAPSPAGAPLGRSAGTASLSNNAAADAARGSTVQVAGGPQGHPAASGGVATQASAAPVNPAPSTVSRTGGTTAAPSSGTRTSDPATGSSSSSASSGSSSNSSGSVSSAQGVQAPSRANGSAAPATASPTPAAAAPAPESPYLDGKYTAWGIRTGHGDIEATVEISGGRIASVFVSNCQMRWPCTDVDPLLGRIVRAQRPQVPVITGATQSSDAFTTAVTEALTLARAAKTAQSPTP